MRDSLQPKVIRGVKCYEFDSYDQLLKIGEYKLNNLESGIGILFKNIKFLSPFFGNINLDNRTITFEICTFEDKEEFNSNTSVLSFDNCRFLGNPNFEFIFAEELNEISFNQCRGSNISFNGFRKMTVFKVKECNFHSLFLERLIINTLFLSGPNNFTNLEIISGDIATINIEGNIEHLRIQETINFHLKLNRIVCEEISIVVSSVIYVSLNHVESKKFSFKLSPPTVEDPIINDFSIVSCNFQDFYASTSLWRMEQKIKRFFISDSSNIRLVAMDIDFLILKNSINSFEATNCKFLSLSFKSFKSNTNVSFNIIQFPEIDSELNLVYSSLKGVTINPSFLHQLKKIKFDKSSIQGMNIFNLIDIPEVVINPKIHDRDQETQYLSLYRELKSLAQSHNNNYLVQRFKALEYNELLDDKSQNIKLGDKIILKANKWSNNHGTKPFYALKWIAIIIIVYAGILSIFYNKEKYSSYWWFLSDNYTYFFTPFEFLNELKISINLTGIYYFDVILGVSLHIIDLVYKLTIGYLIYQLIFAFRKFNI